MRELIYDNVRIQFLSEEVLRLEVRYGAYFTDRNTPVSYTHLDVYKRQLRTLLRSDFRASTESERRRVRVNCNGIL